MNVRQYVLEQLFFWLKISKFNRNSAVSPIFTDWKQKYSTGKLDFRCEYTYTGASTYACTMCTYKYTAFVSSCFINSIISSFLAAFIARSKNLSKNESVYFSISHIFVSLFLVQSRSHRPVCFVSFRHAKRNVMPNGKHTRTPKQQTILLIKCWKHNAPYQYLPKADFWFNKYITK